jgi:hypothetical protein
MYDARYFNIAWYSNALAKTHFFILQQKPVIYSLPWAPCDHGCCNPKGCFCVGVETTGTFGCENGTLPHTNMILIWNDEQPVDFGVCYFQTCLVFEDTPKSKWKMFTTPNPVIGCVMSVPSRVVHQVTTCYREWFLVEIAGCRQMYEVTTCHDGTE